MKIASKLTQLGRDPKSHHGTVNPPVYHASTITWETLEEFDSIREEMKAGKKIVSYGLHGTPTQFSLESALTELEGGYDCRLFETGLAANIMAIIPFLETGDHLLVSDGIYGPVRNFCSNWAKKWGVETTYYDPMIGSSIEELIRPNTRLVILEAPSSVTLEVQDVPAITEVCRRHDVITVIDNTWATPVFYRPFDHGVNISVHALTKYVAGHSDVMLGAIVADEKCWQTIKQSASEFGHHASPDDTYLALRGLRSLNPRLKQHEASALKIARFLEERPEVVQVLHPALPSCPGHEVWKRDFSGSSGLFSFELPPMERKKLAEFIDGLKFFPIGGSWGGYESLIQPFDDTLTRSTATWPFTGPLMRISIGLEDPDDLIADLKAGLERLKVS